MKKIFFIIAFLFLVPMFATAQPVPEFVTDGNISGLVESTRIAIDEYGNVYVSDSLSNTESKSVKVFSASGTLLSTLNFSGKPLGIAVSGGKLYVGDDSEGSVKIYSVTYDGNNKPVSFAFISYLGNGAGQFGMPNSIAISARGRIYVVDSTAHYNTDNSAKTGKLLFDASANHVKIFDKASGSFIGEFGPYGNGNAQMQFPVDIAIDDITGTIFVGDNSNGKIQFFDPDGKCIRITDPYCSKDASGLCKDCKNFGSTVAGTNPDTQVIRLQGLSVDNLSRIYVIDAYQDELKVYDPEGSYMTKVGKYGKGRASNGNCVDGTSSCDDQLDHPIGVCINKSGKVFITSSNSEKVVRFAISNYSLLKASPENLSFSAFAGGQNPSAQTILITSVDAPILWTATTNASWIKLGQSSGTTTSSLSVSVDISNLAVNTYSGNIAINDAGIIRNIPVSLVVSTPILENSPELKVTQGAQDAQTMIFDGEADGNQPLPQDLLVTIKNGSDLTWFAVTRYTNGTGWLNLSKTSGTDNNNLTVSVNNTGLIAGEYKGSIVITVPGAINSPWTIDVTFYLSDNRGTIKIVTNNSKATFSITGPSNHTGSSMTGVRDSKTGKYTVTYTKMKPGKYQVAFDRILGFALPLQKTADLQAGGTLTLEGVYVAPKASNSIVVGSGEQASVRVFNEKGDLGREFAPFAAYESVKVAVGDVDGDGVNEIISTLWDGPNNRSFIVVTRQDGTELASFAALDSGMRYGATIAVGDIDGDGKAEIVVGGGPGPLVPARIKIYKYVGNKIVDTGVETVAFDGGYGVNVALGDIDGDGQLELITTPGPNPFVQGSVKTWKIDMSNGIGKWNLSMIGYYDGLEGSYGATLAAGDIDGDGADEIILGAGPGPENDARVKVLKGDGAPLGLEFVAGSWKYGVNIAAGDIIGNDGIAEIVVSPGHGLNNSSIVKVFNSAGTLMNEFRAFKYKYGANVAIGGF